jgi:hypothetical protein
MSERPGKLREVLHAMRAERKALRSKVEEQGKEIERLKGLVAASTAADHIMSEGPVAAGLHIRLRWEEKENDRLRAEIDQVRSNHGHANCGEGALRDLITALRVQISRLTRERDEARAEVERLTGDKRRCHALLQGAFALIDPEADGDISDEIADEIEGRNCEPGRCVDLCEAERSHLQAENATLRAALEEARSLIGECVELINSAYLNIPGWTDGPRNPGVVMLDASLWFSRLTALTEPGKEGKKKLDPGVYVDGVKVKDICSSPWGVGTYKVDTTGWNPAEIEDYGDEAYGYPNPDRVHPLDFRPDLECVTSMELEAWFAAVRKKYAEEQAR